MISGPDPTLSVLCVCETEIIRENDSMFGTIWTTDLLRVSDWASEDQNIYM